MSSYFVWLNRGKESVVLDPRLIHASLSGYGRGGPYEHKKAYDLLVQCEAGLMSVTGGPDSPAKVGVSIADILLPPVTSRESGIRLGRVPDLGENTEAVLAELGLSAQE